jgi:hypothetical protein
MAHATLVVICNLNAHLALILVILPSSMTLLNSFAWGAMQPLAILLHLIIPVVLAVLPIAQLV